MERQVINTQYKDRQALGMLGLYEDIVWMYGLIGWYRFLQMVQLTFIPLTLEFFGSVDVRASNYHDRGTGEITFCLANVERLTTLQQLNHVWNLISDEHFFYARLACASFISNPSLKYLHRVHHIWSRGE